MIVLCGKGGSGKDTIARILKETYGFRKAVTCTTRPKRPGEQDGVDYHFLTEEDFLKKIEDGVFAEVSSTGEYMYGSPKEIYHEKNTVIILDPNGIRQARENAGMEKVCFICLDADENLLRTRMLGRGDSPEKIEARITEDRARFKEVEKYVDITVRQKADTQAEELACFVAGFAG